MKPRSAVAVGINFDRLIDLAADLGDGPVMVLGSSRQRQAINPTTPSEAAERLADGLARMAPHAEKRGVSILMEPLAPHLCNVVNSMDEAVALVKKIGSPAVQSMFDTHNTTAETLPLTDVIRKHISRIRHVHLSELERGPPQIVRVQVDWLFVVVVEIDSSLPRCAQAEPMQDQMPANAYGRGFR